ncbi:Uncharacterized protein HZ326_6883 [Fusarium oxysporum f. sp. albedinis]|nr:Uncharacterized protein HZ326_6883 [Fusarium oxysporum f. sp. albedinis]
MHWPRSQVSGYLSLTAPTNVPIASPFTSVTQRQLIQETIDIDTVSILPIADSLNSRIVEPFAYYPSLSSLLWCDTAFDIYYPQPLFTRPGNNCATRLSGHQVFHLLVGSEISLFFSFNHVIIFFPHFFILSPHSRVSITFSSLVSSQPHIIILQQSYFFSLTPSLI